MAEPRPLGSRVLAVVAATAAVVLATCAGVGWMRGPGAAPADTPAAPPGRFGVGALGRLEPGWKVHVVGPASTADGARVESLAVEEGDRVAAGAVLAVLDTHARRKAALDEAAAQAAVARARLALVKAGAKPEDLAAQEALVARNRVTAENAATVFQRAERLVASRALSAEEYEQRRMDLAASQATLRQAVSTLAALRAVRAEDVAVAEAELARADAGVARAAADLDATKILAPIAGRVLKIHARAGERVGEAGLAELGDTAEMHAVAEVYERDVPRVAVGQRARARVQSLPGELAGEVVHVGWRVGRRVVLDNDPVKDTDARVVEVRVRLDSASSARVAGLSYARVEVAIDAPPAGGD